MAKTNEMADMKLSNVLGDNHKLNCQMFNFSFQIKKNIGLTPLIALIWISVESAVTQNCVASVTKTF